jgi:hypothetical protein
MGGENKKRMKFRVVNLRDEAADVRVCRPSIWGNPFKVVRYKKEFIVEQKCFSKKAAAHAYAVEQYAEWLEDEGWIVERLIARCWALNKDEVTLGCWCVPLPCHGQVLADILTEKWSSGDNRWIK